MEVVSVLSSISLLNQFDQTKTFRHVKRFVHGWLPRDFVRMPGRTLAAELIHAKRMAGRGRPLVDGGKRDPHGGVPDMLLVIDFGENLES
jgi:hypothetical protein